ncbi:glycoside hydrolase [Caldicoprobacter algeriensis]|uniref:glycosyl hydrolase n=1 Tax=Caldicoprobacter algeriensis TaxID=699281 RepID=UPI002079F0EB|nr:glycosyl hydrolase [Caldicoprobacter algeriensis]MCM8900698.1 glycoside hydrolase [Caldicoprobacter algeriensis]
MNLEDFKSPGPIYRPAPFWSWNDKLDKEELKRQISEMAQKGWGGYFMHSRVGLVTGYLSQQWMEMVRTCAQHARATQTFAWLYDEDKWPSGFAGGEVPTASEEYRSRALVLLKKEELTENDTVLAEYVHEGDTYYICKRVSTLGNAWFNGTCYVDLMNPEAVKAFIDCTHERYKEACGEYFGKEIPGIFTDEPCYLMAGHYNVPALPWSECLPPFFKNLKGYDIEEHLHELFFDVDDYRKVRFDFFDVATRLFLESFTKQYYTWCENNNLKMTGHFMAEDTLLSQLQWIGAAMPHYEFMHWPGIDKLGRHVDQLVTVKQVTSVVDQLGKERAFCEVFGCIGQQSSFYHRKWIADWQAALGISFVNHHLSLYSMRGERKRDYPPNFYYQQPWWENERQFGDYIGRLCYAVSQGKRDVDILVLHPIASVWSEYSPLHRYNNYAIENGIYDEPFTNLSKALMANKLDFHYGDEMIMEKYAKVVDGKLVIGQHSYSTVVVPPALTLRSSTLRLLKEFAQAAGPDRLIFMYPMPERIDGRVAAIDWPEGIHRVKTISDVISILDGYYKDRIRIIDEATGFNAHKILCHQRSLNQGRLLFLANTDEKREVWAKVSVPGQGTPLILDLMSGKAFRLPAVWRDGRMEFKVRFYSAGSLLILLPNAEIPAKPAPAYLDSGVQLVEQPLALQFVRDWEVSVLEQNVMPINDVTLYLDGKLVAQDEPVTKVLHQWFYKAPERTPFRAEYTFEVLNLPEGEVFAAIEVAENLDRITCNGVEVKPLKRRGEMGAFDPQKSWKDVNFTKVPLTGTLMKGKNKLVLEGKKSNNITGPGTHLQVEDFESHAPTEVEAVYIVGDFAVVDDDKVKFAIDGCISVSNCGNLTVSGYPFYAGKAEFKSCVDLKADVIEEGKRIYLKINDVKAACIELYVNGRYCGIKYWHPYVFDVTEFIKAGQNEIKLVAATTLFNLMGPNRVAGIEDALFVGPHTFVDFANFTERYTVLPFGVGSAAIMLG